MAFDSLFIGVSGLESYQNQIDVISNNIANTGTTGFKAQDVTFQDLLYQNQRYATAPTNTQGGVNGQDVGLGVKIGSIDTRFTQGGLQTTGINTDLAMNGDGFFILRDPNASGTPVYTRDGHFSLNANGLLYDPTSGMAVQGYTAGSNGKINQTGTPNDITIPIGLASQAVGTGLNGNQKFGPSGDSVYDVSLGGNLDQTQWIKEAQGLQSATPTAGAGTPYTISTTIYDSLGNAHLAQITYTPDATGAVPGTATATTNPVVSGGGNLVTNLSGTGSTYTGNLTVTVNGAGTLATVTDANGNSTTGAAGSTVNIDGVSFALGTFGAADAGKSGTIGATASSSGLPAKVADPNGQLHSVASRWKVSVSFADGTQFDGIGTPGSISAGGVVTNPTTNVTSNGTVGYAYFDQNGQYVNTSGIESVALTAGGAQQNLASDVHSANTSASYLDGNQLNVTAWGTGTSNNATAPTAGAAPALGPIALGFSNSTSLSATYSANVLAQNGYAAGILSNITVGQDGTVTGSFTNGQTQTLAQIAVATFQNEDGLQRIGNSQFAQTSNSGLAQVGTAASGRYGAIVSGALEQSNVSIADEFTKMIQAQNAYQANSKSITVASENMQTLENLIR